MPRHNARSKRLQKRYGITTEQYRKALLLQHGVCAICGRPPKKRRLSVDHDHKTHVVRGLLCVHCNRFLVCKNDRETAAAVLAYLSRDFDVRLL